MSRETACKIFKLLRSGENFSATKLAAEVGITDGNAREWLATMDKHGIVTVVGLAERDSTRGTQPYLWGLKEQR